MDTNGSSSQTSVDQGSWIELKRKKGKNGDTRTALPGNAATNREFPAVKDRELSFRAGLVGKIGTEQGAVGGVTNSFQSKDLSVAMRKWTGKINERRNEIPRAASKAHTTSERSIPSTVGSNRPSLCHQRDGKLHQVVRHQKSSNRPSLCHQRGGKLHQVVGRQRGGDVAINIPETQATTSTSPAPTRGVHPSPQPPSGTPPTPGDVADLDPSSPGPPPPPGPPSPPPSPSAQHLPLPEVQDHYWTVIHKDPLVEFLNLSSKQVREQCNLDASEEATISCVDIKYPSYVLPTTGGYSIVMLPNIFCIIGRERSYIRHDIRVEHEDEPFARLAKKIAEAWSGGEGFDLHVLKLVFGATLEGLLDEKKTLDLRSSASMTEVARMETFIRKNIYVKQAVEDASRIFMMEREKGSSLSYFICRCEDNIRHLSDVVKEAANVAKEAERRMAGRKDRREKLLFWIATFSAIAAFLGMLATLSVGITPSSPPSSLPPSVYPSPLPSPSITPSLPPSPSITPSLPGILTLQKALFSIAAIFTVLLLLSWIVMSCLW